ncbi:GAF domain-containing protein [Photobacterium sp. SP02]
MKPDLLNHDIPIYAKTALLAGEKHLLEMTSRNAPLPHILHVLCQLVEQTIADCRCSIVVLDSRGSRLQYCVAPSIPTGYSEFLHGQTVQSAAGPCAIAAKLKEQVIIADITKESHPNLHAWCRHALAYDLHACWSTPILSSADAALGSFAIYYQQPCLPTLLQQQLIKKFVHLASIAIERTQIQDKLLRSEASLARAQRLSATGSFSYYPISGEIIFSAETRRIYEFEPDGYISPIMVRERIHPDDVALFLHMLFGQQQDFSFECRLLLPDGRVKHLQVAANALRNETGELVEWAGAVQDISDRIQSAAALKASEKLARDQLQALTHMLDSLAQETEPDKLIEHALRTITTQLGATSCCVWLQDTGSPLFAFAYGFEQDKLLDRDNASLSSIFPVLDLQQHWPHLRQTRQPVVLTDIRNMNDFPCRQHQLDLGVQTMLIVPVLVSGEVEGLLATGFTGLRQFLPEELMLSQALAQQTMLVLQLSRLSVCNQEAAVIAERCRLARDIHDTLAQGMTGVILQLEAAADVLNSSQPGQLEQHIQQANDLARQSLHEAKRSVQALRPLVLEEKNLSIALRELCHLILSGQQIRLQYIEQGTAPSLPQILEDNILRIVQEVLTNCLRYAAASEFALSARYSVCDVQLIMQDNGCGFDLHRTNDGYGLIGIRERAQLMGAEVHIYSAPGAGTRLELRLSL